MILNEKEFYDYRTAPVDGSEVVDKYRTGMSFYDDFLRGDKSTLDYLRKEKNLVGEVKLMSPEEYYQACSDHGFTDSHPSVETLKQQRSADKATIDHLRDVLTVAKKRFPMPVLNVAESAQEGLHRMFVIGELFGWDHKVPVLIVDWADKQRAYEIQKRARTERIRYNLRNAVLSTLRYEFRNFDEFKEQLQWEIDKQFEYNPDNITTPVKFDISQRNNEVSVAIGAAEFQFDYDDISFLEDDVDLDDDDFDIDDLELDSSEDFLRRYFGDDWRTTHPHLKSTFNITESVERLDIQQMDQAIQNRFASDVPGEGCIFIAKNGKFINIYPTLDDHEDLCYWLEESGFDDTPGDAEWFVDTFEYVRCRNSKHLCFIELPITYITREQLYSLEEWLQEKVSSDSLDIELPDGRWNTYDLHEYFPEDLIKIIKRFYASGTLYENIN